MKIVKSIIVSALLFLLGLKQHMSQMKVAVVIFNKYCNHPKPNLEKLEGQFKARQTKISDQQKTLQDQLDKFKKESTTMSQKDRDAVQKKIAADRADLVKQVVAYQQDLQKEQNKVMQGILGDLNGIVSKIAKNQIMVGSGFTSCIYSR